MHVIPRLSLSPLINIVGLNEQEKWIDSFQS